MGQRQSSWSELGAGTEPGFMVVSFQPFSCLRVLGIQSFSWPEVEWGQKAGHVCLAQEFLSTYSLGRQPISQGTSSLSPLQVFGCTLLP